MNDGKTCLPDWEAMYRSACQELEKGKYENAELREENRYLKNELMSIRAIKQTVEVILGGSSVSKAK